MNNSDEILNALGYGKCPKCGHECWEDVVSGPEPNLVAIKNRHPNDTDYGPGEDWTEVYLCPKCSTLFEVQNGYP